jgi:hypothetical protein
MSQIKFFSAKGRLGSSRGQKTVICQAISAISQDIAPKIDT